MKETRTDQTPCDGVAHSPVTARVSVLGVATRARHRSSNALAGLLVATALIAGVMTPALGAATPPSLVNYQGVLRSAAGTPLNGTYDMVFRFVDAPAGGTLLLTDLHTGPNGVVVTGGLFSTLLGGGTLSPGTEPGLTEVLANHEPVYLEVQVGAESLSPRVRMVSAAYAVNAGRLGGLPATSFLDTSASTQTKAGSLVSNTGFVGNASGAGNGVLGTTATGAGVRGTSTGSGTTYGVYGQAASTTGTGVAGEATATSGNAWGVYGKSASSTGIGVIGSALAATGATEGVRGQNTSPAGRGVVGAAFATTGDARGVYGESQSIDGTGVYGRATTATGSTTGVGGDCFSTLGTGVAGVANATSGDAWGVYGATLSAAGYGVVSEGDSATIGDIYATGTKFFITEHPNVPDRSIQYACIEGGEVGVYHRGSGRLVGGEAKVDLPGHFPLVAAGQLTVQLTPLEECAGLYVPKDSLSTSGFTVRELGGGRSGAAFSYVVMAERRGYEEAEVVRPVTIAQKVLMSPRLTRAEKASLRSVLGRVEAATFAPEDLSQLYDAIHKGEYAAACRLLKGCPEIGPVDPEVAAGRDTTKEVNPVH